MNHAFSILSPGFSSPDRQLPLPLLKSWKPPSPGPTFRPTLPARNNDAPARNDDTPSRNVEMASRKEAEAAQARKEAVLVREEAVVARGEVQPDRNGLVSKVWVEFKTQYVSAINNVASHWLIANTHCMSAGC